MQTLERTPELAAPPEPWVDVSTIARHLGFGRTTIIKMAEDRRIPGVRYKIGARAYWRFKLSAVDAALSEPSAVTGR